MAGRFAASKMKKGEFDVVIVDNDMACPVVFWQGKSGYMSCAKAVEWLKSAWMRLGMPYNYAVGVVHRTKEKEFCEH
jgi:hypothetical protein